MYVLGWAQWQDDIGGGGVKAAAEEKEEEGGKFRQNKKKIEKIMFLVVCDKFTSGTVFAPKDEPSESGGGEGLGGGGERKY